MTQNLNSKMLAHLIEDNWPHLDELSKRYLRIVHDFFDESTHMQSEDLADRVGFFVPSETYDGPLVGFQIFGWGWTEGDAVMQAVLHSETGQHVIKVGSDLQGEVLEFRAPLDRIRDYELRRLLLQSIDYLMTLHKEGYYGEVSNG